MRQSRIVLAVAALLFSPLLMAGPSTWTVGQGGGGGGGGVISGNATVGGNVLPQNAAARVVTPSSTVLSSINAASGYPVQFVVPSDNRPVLMFTADGTNYKTAKCSDALCSSVVVSGGTIFTQWSSLYLPAITLMPDGNIAITAIFDPSGTKTAYCGGISCTSLGSFGAAWGDRDPFRVVATPSGALFMGVYEGYAWCSNPPSCSTSFSSLSGYANAGPLATYTAGQLTFMRYFTSASTSFSRYTNTPSNSPSATLSSLNSSTYGNEGVALAATVNPVTGFPAFLWRARTSPATVWQHYYVKCIDVACSGSWVINPIGPTTSVNLTNRSANPNWTGVNADMVILNMGLSGVPVIAIADGTGANYQYTCTDGDCASISSVSALPSTTVSDPDVTLRMAVSPVNDVYTAVGRGANFSVSVTPLGSYVFSGTNLGTAALPLANATISGLLSTGDLSVTRGTTSATYSTATNCSSTASPAACGNAAAGRVVIAVGATSVVVNTTSVTAASVVIPINDDSTGAAGGCNTTGFVPKITAKTAGTSFTISIPAAPVTTQACFTYFFAN